MAKPLAAQLCEHILLLPGVEERPLYLADAVVPQAYWLNDTEFVHFHGGAQIDLRVPEAGLRQAMLDDPRAKINPYAHSRIEFDFVTPKDVEDAIRLVTQVHALLSQAAR